MHRSMVDVLGIDELMDVMFSCLSVRQLCDVLGVVAVHCR